MSLINDGINWVKTDEEGIPVTKVLEEFTWANKLAASKFGKGQAWFSDIGAMGYSDGIDWYVGGNKEVFTAYRDTDIAIAATSLAPFYVTEVTTLNRVAGNIGTTQATKLVEIGIYSENLTKLASTERQEVPEAGAFEFSHPEITLTPGKYYYAVSCNGTTATFGHALKHGGLTATLSLPLATLASVVPATSFPALTGYAVETPTISNFADISVPGVRVYGKDNSNSQPYGWNTITGKLCYSTNSGASFIDLMSVPPVGSGHTIYDIILYNSQLYVLADNLKVYQSSDLTASATWTDISCPTTAGLRRATAVARPYGFAIFNDYLVLGEYSNTGADLQNDPSDPAPPRILKYGPIATSPTWAVTKQMANARHIHSLFTENSSKLWASVGDATYGADVGIWRCTSITADTWAKWTSNASPYTDHYPVDFIEINPGVGAPTGLYCTSDRPGKHLLYSKVTGTAGSFNLSARAWRKNSDTSETVRSMVLDTKTKNIYYFTAETSDPALYVSPAPYNQSYRLASVSTALMARSVISGSYLLMFDKRFSLAKFPWQ